MDPSSHTILITGGASGIGLALAERFLRTGSEVIVCGRSLTRLDEAKEKLPDVHIRVCDLAQKSERVLLFQRITEAFPRLDVLVNNAGIQHWIRLSENEDWEKARSEIAINFEAPVHLSMLFVPHLLKQTHPALINVTSGLAFVPMAAAPVYCAAKAALRSFTLSLRHQLSETPVEVIEIIPPAVNTDLGGAGRHAFGVPIGEFADAVMEGLRRGDREITYGFSEEARAASPDELSDIFVRMNP